MIKEKYPANKTAMNSNSMEHVQNNNTSVLFKKDK